MIISLAALLAAGLAPSSAHAANKSVVNLPAINTGVPLVAPNVPLSKTGVGAVVLPEVKLGASLPGLEASAILTSQPGAVTAILPQAVGQTPGAVSVEATKINVAAPQGPVNGENEAAAAGKIFDNSAELPAVDVNVPATTPGEAGELTLKKLDAFTLTGPRPAQRGLPFWLAQGAKAVSDALVSAWKNVRPQSGSGEKAVGVLMRRDGRTEIMVAREGDKPMWLKVDPKATQSIVTSSLVSVTYSQNLEVTSIRAVGTSPMDMVIGRVVERGGKKMLESLFRVNGAPSSGYEGMPLDGSMNVQKGAIVQAYVKPTGAAFQAVPMVDLGSKITPEIAAREIALRSGGRGHIEREIIEQAENEARDFDAVAEFNRLNERLKAAGLPLAKDYRKDAFVTIDPIGAGDLDDAYHVIQHEDGSTTWILATAGAARLVRPGTAGFRAAIGKGNTFYTIDKDGVPEYPMIHPVISKDKASLISGQDRLAMITTMRFGPEGEFLQDESSVGLGLVRVQGRYTYDQVVELWQGKKDHGITHLKEIALARELARKLNERDAKRGKLDFSFLKAEPVKTPEGWKMQAVRESDLAKESHRLIEELKVYGNRVIARELSKMTKRTGVPHMSRVHPPQNEKKNQSLKQELQRLGVPWETGEISDYLTALHKRDDLSAELRDVAQVLVLTSRSTARFSAEDGLGHEGLALGTDEYDQPSAGIRRGADLINLALLDAVLEGGDPRAVYETMLADFKSLGLYNIDMVAEHLTNRQIASKGTAHEVRDFMSLYELAKTEHWKKPLKGYVSFSRQRGRDRDVTIQLREPSVTVKVTGDAAEGLEILNEVEVVITGANLSELRLDYTVRKIEGRGARGRGERRSRDDDRRFEGRGRGRGRGNRR